MTMEAMAGNSRTAGRKIGNRNGLMVMQVCQAINNKHPTQPELGKHHDDRSDNG
ncbi:hypothetical protein [Alcaligenes faecalis]|uniref:hypothetical protein n=1 Tax=Alcaligenes faecalis TaxID=511 RepID=UPI00131DE8DC|nr:hypothetical protein [Alcaligenes faecalis]